MAITLGTPAYAYRASGSGASISYSIPSFSVPTDATGLLIYVHILTAIVGTPVVTFTNGTTVTATLEKTAAGGMNQGQVFVYSVANPAPGTGAVTFSQPDGFTAGYIDASYIEAIAVSGGDATAVVHAADAKGSGNTSAPSVTTAAADCVLVATAGTYYNGNTPSYSGPTSSALWVDNDNTNFIFTGRSLAAQPAGTYTATWTVGYNGVVASLVALNPGSGGGGGGGGTPQTLTLAGIASTEAVGAPTKTSAVTRAQTNIPSAEAFGAITRSSSVTRTLTGMASTEAFGAAALVQTGAITLTGIASGEAFGALTAAPGTATRTPSGIASGEAFGATSITAAGGGGGAAGFAFYRAITIDHTKVAADQTDFPVLVAGTFPYLAAAANGGNLQSASGYDFAFYADASGTTLLDFERVTWNANTGSVEAWVRIPSLAASADTTIYLLYGNAAQFTDLQNKTGVWDAASVAVFHCADTPAVGGAILDSSSSANHLTISAGGSGSGSSTLASVAGAWDGSSAIRFSQQSEYYSNYARSTGPSGMGVNHATLSLWYKPLVTHAGFDGNETIFGAKPTVYPNHTNQILRTKADTAQYQAGTESTVAGETAALALNEWSYLTATFDGSRIGRVYLNGSQAAAKLIPQSTVDDVLWLAAASEGGYDELRVANVARSASWIATEYRSMSDPAFLAIGSESTSGASLAVNSIASSEAFGAPALAAGTATLPHTGIASAEALGTPSLTGGSRPLALSGISSGEAFGLATVQTAGGTLALTGIPSAQAFGSPAVSPGSAPVATLGIASGEAFGTPAKTSAVTRNQTGIASTEAFGAPSIGNFTVLAVAGIPPAETFGTPALAAGNTAITPSGIPPAEAFGLPVFGSGALVFAVTGIPSAESFGSVTRTAQTPLPQSGIPSSEAFGSLLVLRNGRLLASGVPTAEAFGTSGIVGAAVLNGTAIASGEAFGLFSTAAHADLALTGIPSAEAFGAAVFERPIFVQLTGIPSAEASSGARLVPARPVRIITFPNGQVLTSMALTPQAINVTLQTLTACMLGVDPASDPQAYYKVRLEWPTQGQPGWRVDEDICFVRATEEDGAYNKIRDRRLSYQDAATLGSTDTYTRIWRVTWAFYGPTGFDNARLVKSALMSLDFATETLAQMSLYLNTEIGATTRAPEKFQGQWWERTDLSVLMNELVTESLTVHSIASAEVILNSNDGGQLAEIAI